MATTLTNLLYHIVFSTRGRLPILSSELREDLYPYLGGIIRGEKGVLLAVGGTSDHIHLLAKLPPPESVSDALRRVKGNSSTWVNKRMDSNRFGWQRGYGAFSVSESSAQDVASYIARQETHHRKMTFQEEFVRLLQKHRMDYDERYLWD